MNKYRSQKIKREHSIIEHGWEALLQISAIDEVDAIIPGVINRLPGQKKLEIRFQYFTDQGLKLQIKNTTSIQEVFVVTNQREKVLDRLREQKLLLEKKAEGVGTKGTKANKGAKKKRPLPPKLGQDRPKAPGKASLSFDERIARAAGADSGGKGSHRRKKN